MRVDILPRKLIAYIIPILFILISTSGCIDFKGDLANTKSFQNKEIYFSYPSSWVSFSDFWPSNFGFSYKPSTDQELNATVITGVLDPKSNTPIEKYSTSVKIETKNNSGTLKETFDNTYSSLSHSSKASGKSLFQNISERILTVDGVSAYEKVYKIPHGEPYYQIRDVWIYKNGKIYIISCRAFPNNFNQSQNDFDIIINSFHVK
jgi:PsbP-like protein